MSPEAALRWFRRAVNAAIVTGGDRTDLIMQALETKPSAIILTGNLYPSMGVLIKAKETGTPILLVPYDTFTTIEKLKEMQGIVTADSLKTRDKDLITIIEKEIKWKELLT
jgi:BioD-like phosphotransacetylase family protein